MGYVDPVLQRLRALQEQAQAARAAAGQSPPPPPPEINLTITLPPLEMHVENTVQPTPVTVRNDVKPAPAQVTSAPPATVRVNVPAGGGAKEITFERDSDGRIAAAKVTDG